MGVSLGKAIPGVGVAGSAVLFSLGHLKKLSRFYEIFLNFFM